MMAEQGHIHILGIGGTFMGSLAQLAVERGYRVTGCDENVYPPMLEQLERTQIDWQEGFDKDPLDIDADIYVIGNCMSRGNALVEAILDLNLRYTSGPQFLCDYLLADKWVLACAGTHGKTTTSSMLAWVLEQAEMSPGFLIGGVPQNFGCSARMGSSDFFVIEADEYDSAFFDKRSKFIHYRARTLILNNLEFDHADIFDDVAAIQKQCHHLIRTLSQQTAVITPLNHQYIDEVLAMGCWSKPQSTSTADGNADWYAETTGNDGSQFKVFHLGELVATVDWSLSGEHNIANGIAVFAAAYHVGVRPEITAQALNLFAGVKRRMELLAVLPNPSDSRFEIEIYDDFAHHPSAIEATLDGLRNRVGKAPIIALIEAGSNSMKMGVHQLQLRRSIVKAHRTIWYQNANSNWDMQQLLTTDNSLVIESVEQIIDEVLSYCKLHSQSDIHIVIMSNGSFDGLQQQLISALN